MPVKSEATLVASVTSTASPLAKTTKEPAVASVAGASTNSTVTDVSLIA
ncbi:hypothetical protein [Metalysinibacillus jejuensis]|nr:hypothetical protein [Metalysinibacillus jejuensis]